MKQYLPPLKSLHVFMVAGQLNSFKQAAKQLFVTQAAVSQQIKMLEQHLDMRLFERTGRQTVLTSNGRKLLPFIEQGYTSFTAGIQAVSGDNQPNILRISATISFTSMWLMPRLQAFQKLHPNLMLQIAPCNDLVDFDHTEIDLAIRMGSGNYEGLSEKKLVSDELILVASPKIVDASSQHDANVIFSLPWIEDSTPGSQLIFKQACIQYGIDSDTLTSVIRSSDSVILIENALAGRGFTMVSKSFVADHLRSGDLVPLLDFGAPSPWCLFLVAPEQHFQLQKIKLFEQWIVPLLHESFDDLAAW
jgi:LysR family glycine cleavage system transcriptional activator